jgi:hypothetical protein
MEKKWPSPDALLDAIVDLEDALRKNDPHIIRNAAETVVVTRDQFFDTARSFVATILPRRD